MVDRNADVFAAYAPYPVLTRENAGEEVRLAEKVGREHGRRLAVDREGIALLLDLTVVEEDDLVGHRERFLLIVRNEHGRRADLPLEIADLILHLGAHLAVERGERLVQQEDVRLGDKRAGQCHALLLAAGELRHAAGVIAAELHKLERLVDALVDLRLGDFVHLEAVAHVFRHVHGGEQRVVLEHKTDVALFRAHLRHVRAVYEHLALVRGLQTADDAEDRCLAAAGGAEQ